MRQVVDFLTGLRSNNNKIWFDAHKTQYLAARKEFEAFTEQQTKAGRLHLAKTVLKVNGRGFQAKLAPINK